MKYSDVNFRYFKKNRYSIAALLPLVPDAKVVNEPRNGIMLYSFSTPQKEYVYKEVDEHRKKLNAVWVAGGPHPSARPQEVLEHFDYVVVGEGESVLPKLIEVLRRGEIPEIEGVGRLEDGEMVLKPQRKYVSIDEYPPFSPQMMAPIEITRGCPHSCGFCQTPRLFGRKMRHRSIGKIVKYAKYRDVRFISPNALAYGSDGIEPNLEKVEKLLSSLKGKRVFFGTFPCEVRPEFVSDRALEIIGRYCYNTHICIGAQSGSDRVLKILRRGHETAEVYKAVELCVEHGFKPVVDMIFGLPFENEEDERRSLDMVRWITNKGGLIRAHKFMPLPGTPLEHYPPTQISDRVKRVLGKLALKGKVRGRWEL
jgi:B12-binding domain/radical SAM domain protein